MNEITSNWFLTILVLATIINIVLGFVLGFKYEDATQFIISFIGSLLLLTVFVLFDAIVLNTDTLTFIKGAVLVCYFIITLYQALRLRDGNN